MEKNGNSEQFKYYEDLDYFRQRFIRAAVIPIISGRESHRTETGFSERIGINYTEAVLSQTPDSIAQLPQQERDKALMLLATTIISERVNRFNEYNSELEFYGYEPEFIFPGSEEIMDAELALDIYNQFRVDHEYKLLKQLYNQSTMSTSSFKYLIQKRIYDEINGELGQIKEAVEF